jgi:hypothetical protein
VVVAGTTTRGGRGVSPAAGRAARNASYREVLDSPLSFMAPYSASVRPRALLCAMAVAQSSGTTQRLLTCRRLGVRSCEVVGILSLLGARKRGRWTAHQGHRVWPASTQLDRKDVTGCDSTAGATG